jgi:hypothetical protein
MLQFGLMDTFRLTSLFSDLHPPSISAEATESCTTYGHY